MKMISADDHINGCMHLDSANLSTTQILLIIDMMDLIILNNRKYTTQMSHDTGLSTIMDITSSDNMGTYLFLGPPFQLCLANTVTLCLGTILKFGLGPFIIILRLQIFTQRDPGAFGLIDVTVLNDPTLRPVRPDHAFL